MLIGQTHMKQRLPSVFKCKNIHSTIMENSDDGIKLLLFAALCYFLSLIDM